MNSHDLIHGINLIKTNLATNSLIDSFNLASDKGYALFRVAYQALDMMDIPKEYGVSRFGKEYSPDEIEKLFVVMLKILKLQIFK